MAESPVTEQTIERSETTPKKRKREEDVSPSPAVSAKKVRKELTVKKEPSHMDMSTLATTESAPESPSVSRGVSYSPSSTDNQTSTDATSVDEDTIVVEQPFINPVVSKLRRSRRGSKKSLVEPAELEKCIPVVLIDHSTSTQHPALQDDTDSILSDIPSEIFDDTIAIEAAIEVKPKQAKENKRRKKKEAPPTNDLDHAPAIRMPGDYVLTPRLLVDLASAWITCKLCEEPFVQNDAYFTRSSCPRCERHSKLYGYQWPKTDKEGRDDSEERVLDHRTVHRFIRPAEEKQARKRNRSATRSATESRELSKGVSEAPVEEINKRGKRAKKPRITM